MDLRMIPVIITLCYPIIYLVLMHIQNIKENRATREMLSRLVNEKEELIKKIGIYDYDSCLVIGLGNDRSTPDSLGPLSINNILVTKLIFL